MKATAAKAFVCGMCGYVSLKGEAPEKCPSCGAPETVFKEQADAINEPEDYDNLEDLEKKHVPQLSKTGCGLVEDECTDVHALMGQVIHPMTGEHSIQHIDFYVDKEFAGRVKLTPKGHPAGSFHLKPGGGKLTVVENCNLHGRWMNSMSL